MRILKFGGTSVGSRDGINRVVKIIQGKLKQEKIVVVVSALSGVTDQLAAINSPNYLAELKVRHCKITNNFHSAKEIFQELAGIDQLFLSSKKSAADSDYLMSFGERLSAAIVTEILQKNGIEAEYLDARQIIKTDSNFGKANVDIQQTYQNIQKYFNEHDKLQVVTGFIGSTNKGETTTLGRGSSDYTAALLGAALKASGIEIWKDVDGLMTADPNKDPAAKLIKRISYIKAKKIAEAGVKVICPLAIAPAQQANIPIFIKNTYNIKAEGTIINN
jgi:aspartokinase/homoserine dehydrogenase 1